ncbi:MAG: tetracycline resistance MFS efflux pump [Chloroflexota bacterium]|nr:MAG: tetracycline resistance MFS efflux pump [Chloroflexota bacterium]
MKSEHKLNYKQALPIFALVLVDVLGLSLILPLLHLYATTYGAAPLEVGLVIAAFPLAQLIGLPVMGALSDRFGRKPLLLISQITTCIGFIMLGLANSLFLIILSRIIDGLFGANISTAQAALSDITDEKTRAQGLGLTGAAFGLGFILGPMISIVTLELTDNLQLPAFVAAVCSLFSMLLTIFVFRETLPPERRHIANRRKPFPSLYILRNSNVSSLLMLMFAQQLVFFGFESLLGLFTLSRLGLLGQGNALIFVIVGITLVIVQARFIGPWSRKYGEFKIVYAALGLLAAGLFLIAFTPEQPHPFYVRAIVENKLLSESLPASGAITSTISVQLPDDTNRGVGGLLWIMIIIIPISVGAGLIRPGLNSLMTKQVHSRDYGSVLGLSASFVSAANAAAPLLGGFIFENYGSTAPFLFGSIVVTGLLIISFLFIKPVSPPTMLQAELDERIETPHQYDLPEM